MTIHDDARAASEAVYDAAIRDLTSRLSAAETEAARLNAENTTLTEANTALTTTNTTLRDETVRLEALIGELRTRIAQLEAAQDGVPEGWATIYDTTFAEDDGWEKRQEARANTASYNLPRNVVFGDGLRILGKRENQGTRAYTSGDVLGKHVRIPNYFRIEVTASLPTDYGMWPCPMWLRPLTGGDSGEIDLCEIWPYDWDRTGARAWVTIWENYDTKRKENASLLFSRLPNPDPAAPHTFICEKVKDRIAFWIDDVLVYSWEKPTMNARLASWYDSVYEIEGREWYPRITLGIGGSSPTINANPKPEWQASEMVIHRLRIFKEA